MKEAICFGMKGRVPKCSTEGSCRAGAHTTRVLQGGWWGLMVVDCCCHNWELGLQIVVTYACYAPWMGQLTLKTAAALA